jgi:toxin-antitoxin system PIN domain toxin
MRFILPDINVWLALSAADHAHFKPAWVWYQALENEEILCFCRQTQLGLLRLLTTRSVMGENTQTQQDAWQIYEMWREQESAGFLDEPGEMDALLRARDLTTETSPKLWNDAYLSAFAEAASLTLITFDRSLAGKSKGAVLLQ